QTMQTVPAYVGARAVPFGRSVRVGWAPKPLTPRRAAGKVAGGSRSEADKDESDEVTTVTTESLAEKFKQLSDSEKAQEWIQSEAQNQLTSESIAEVIQRFADGQVSGQNLVTANFQELKESFNIRAGPAKTQDTTDEACFGAYLAVHRTGCIGTGSMLAALGKLDVEPNLLDADAYPYCPRAMRPGCPYIDVHRTGCIGTGSMLAALGKLDVELDLWNSAIELIKKKNSPVKDTALDATKTDLKGYNEMQVASWLVAVLCKTSTADAIKEVVTSLSGMNGPGLVAATVEELEEKYGLSKAMATSLARIVHCLTDPAEITFADIAQDVTYAECVFDGVWVYNLLTRLPCGYIPDAQHLGSVILEDGPQKRCIPVLFGESGSGKTVQALFAPACKMLKTNPGIVRVFACSLPDGSEHLDRVREASVKNNTAVPAQWCKEFVLQEFKERLTNAFPNHGDLVRGWLEDEQRDSSALGSVVFVIDEITKCPELAKGIAACQDDIYKELKRFCDSPQLVMAGTSAARVLEPGLNLDYSSDPSNVCLVAVGQVQGHSFLKGLIDHFIPQKRVSHRDLAGVPFLEPYLSNARTAMLLVEEVGRFVERKDIDSADSYRIWKRFPWPPGCFVPLRYRTLNGLQRITSLKQRELVARNALALLMHLGVAGQGVRPSASDAMICVDLGLCTPSNYSQLLAHCERDPSSKDYCREVTFVSSPALTQMLLAAFSVPTIIPQHGDSFEDIIAEAERRFAEVVTGKRAIVVTLDHALPPQQNQNKMEGIPGLTFHEILAALARKETVVLKNGPSAQGASLVLRRSEGSRKPLVRLIQAKNRRSRTEILPAVAALGATCQNQSHRLYALNRSAAVLHFLCRVVSETSAPQDTDLQGKYGLLFRPGHASQVDVKVELIVWERVGPRRIPRTFRVFRPSFLNSTPIVKLRSLEHLAPFPTDVKMQGANASYMTWTFS
ncbi:unnamed protein product, partial [Symbiodinium microadriaticum]